MKLSKLIASIAVSERKWPAGAPAPEVLEITSLHCRSNEVRPGGLFVAIAGYSVDGHDYIDDAVARGAAAVVVQRPVTTVVPVICIADTRKALAQLASHFFGHPALELTVIGITGTNGKTTTAYLIESILRAAGLEVGVIGTVNYRYGNQTHAAPVTTPDAVTLQAMLREMADAGATHVVMEVSSHALAQGRVTQCPIDVGVFTNLSQDHLDFHGDMERYWAVKKQLFTKLLVEGTKADKAKAVVNSANDYGADLVGQLKLPVITVGGDGALVHSHQVRLDLEGIAGHLAMGTERVAFASTLVGRHNLENILCAAGTAAALGIDAPTIARGIAKLTVVPGRLERVPSEALHVYVDYAHTPDALENAIKALKPLTVGRMVVVFGCGGDRDRTKRPLMGRIAMRLSDLVVVTSDNPRSEDPQAIIEDIVTGIAPTGAQRLNATELIEADRHHRQRGYALEPDRSQAIELAISAAAAGDAVLIAGKGHETYQIISGHTRDFDDRKVAAAALAHLKTAGSQDEEAA
jgi:UDP-N-acetylmuramoyl-L-alanyl-D-glutamate--2,6-diaminopimelate ligase/murE/murF fusion protein